MITLRPRAVSILPCCLFATSFRHDPIHVPVLLDAIYSEHQMDVAIMLPADLRELLARAYRPAKVP